MANNLALKWPKLTNDLINSLNSVVSLIFFCTFSFCLNPSHRLIHATNIHFSVFISHHIRCTTVMPPCEHLQCSCVNDTFTTFSLPHSSSHLAFKQIFKFTTRLICHSFFYELYFRSVIRVALICIVNRCAIPHISSP